jgi:hypothetical protein
MAGSFKNKRDYVILCIVLALWENCFKVPCIIVQTGIFLLVGPKVA